MWHVRDGSAHAELQLVQTRKRAVYAGIERYKCDVGLGKYPILHKLRPRAPVSVCK